MPPVDCLVIARDDSWSTLKCACHAAQIASGNAAGTGVSDETQNHLSTMERGKVEIGAEILLRIGLEVGKSLEWLMTGEDRAKVND
jgi:hypothetical protein